MKSLLDDFSRRINLVTVKCHIHVFNAGLTGLVHISNSRISLTCLYFRHGTRRCRYISQVTYPHSDISCSTATATPTKLHSQDIFLLVYHHAWYLPKGCLLSPATVLNKHFPGYRARRQLTTLSGSASRYLPLTSSGFVAEEDFLVLLFLPGRVNFPIDANDVNDRMCGFCSDYNESNYQSSPAFTQISMVKQSSLTI